ncbi:unnamed protein product [Spirodela intermedia]|uniref:DYW domain-containing protein n=1 Tax=Spirodela intermedia TaxID=51605 RepID=A0A7I8J6M1_SPIIN|nr:unnamed protein product [Spirodela intermedia]CAA6665082.1 unnamed protein product [Spirodela intermedia]
MAAAAAIAANPSSIPPLRRDQTTPPPIAATSPRAAPPPPLTLLPRCRSLRDLSQVHAAAVKSGLNDDPLVLTKLITFCCLHPSSLSMAYARHLFDRMPPQQDPLLFNTMTRGYARTPTPPSPSAFSSSCSSMASPPTATPSREAAARSCRQARLPWRPFVLPTLINLYADCGDLPAARRLFDQSDGGGSCAVCYNAMITACARRSLPGEALQLFRRMQAEGVKPTEVTVLSVLSSCAMLGSLELGRWVHGFAQNQGFLSSSSSSVKVATAVIDMYGKCGSLEDAAAVWSAMIVACALHGRSDLAVSFFREMQTQREEDGAAAGPDGVTFLGLLSACSHAGKVDEGLQLFRAMEDFAVSPETKHYGCVVDLLARAGRLREAHDFILNLSGENSSPVLWRTLLGACASHGDVELGKRVFARILDHDDSHGGDYVILSNLCAAAGRWEEARAVRKMMKEKGAGKTPGCSAIEVGGAVHEFFSGDGRHPQAAALRRMVEEMAEQLGYAPETAVVAHEGMTEEEKAASLRGHSEKLAMNLRVCKDCHAMAKLISAAFGREILLRDLNRFHHFKDGKCSCGDYW